MKNLKNPLGPFCALVALGLLAILPGCSANKSPDVAPQIRQSLDQAGLHNVNVHQDRDKGVITLSGDVNSEDDKSKAESIAKSAAGSEAVANEIAVRPPNDNDAEKIDSALDDGIEKNLKAAFLRHKLNKEVNTSVKNGVVTLSGKVRSQAQRKQAEKIAKGVPNVKEVVNELEVKGQKATASGA